MADGVNKVILLGHIGTDPELRETDAGKSVCNFRMSTTFNQGLGQYRREKTVWHRIVVWGRLAEVVVEHLNRGSKIYVEGYLETKAWEDRRGNERLTTQVVADKVVFLDTKHSFEESAYG